MNTIVEEILLVVLSTLPRVVIAWELQDKIIDEFASSDKNGHILLLISKKNKNDNLINHVPHHHHN